MALYAGSFDPPHLGHLDLIERAAAAFGELLVAVATNPAKGSGLLAVEERTSLLHQVTVHLDNVEVVKHEGLLVELVHTRGVDVIVRGIGREALGELEMAEMNARLGGVRTMFIEPSPSTAIISSRMIRALVAAGEANRVTGLVPSVVSQVLLQWQEGANGPATST